MKIMMAGGGTAGSISPLISIYEKIKSIEPNAEFVFISTKKGIPENEILRGYSMEVIPIYGGKIRRYFDLRNISDIFLTLIGFFQALKIIINTKPDIIIGTGSYISVPVIWAGWVNRVKILIHQQDIVPSLSNIFSINFAHKITVSFEKSLRNFPSRKTIWTGNPVKQEILKGDPEQANQKFNLDKNLPLILVMGGSTGSLGINTIVNQSLPELVKFAQVIVITGPEKKIQGIASDRFKQFEFINDGMNNLLARADLVVSRAGLSSITELSALGKLSILIPMPNTHQEKNAEYLTEHKAAIVINQLNLSPGILIEKIETILNSNFERNNLQQNIQKIMKNNAADLIVGEIINLVKK
ncbi:MAG: undecaprenyldiphospho-muramoylpentapeptide beta-N-acetylglucosaminyltransferase [bacterium]|nr:undecaprenyldiphospho-muramoylpentapeptide beta-N-acetylglucosaminyltransferase [bacterium]